MGQNTRAKKDTDPAGEEADPTRMMCADEGLVGLVWFACFLALSSVPFRYRPNATKGEVQQNEKMSCCVFEFIWRVAPAGHRRNFLNNRSSLPPSPGTDFNPIHM